MTLIVPTDLELESRKRDRLIRRAEEQLAEAASLALRDLLRHMRGDVTTMLTAANPPLPRMTSAFFSLGQIHDWWDDALDTHVTEAVRNVWFAGRAAASDAPPGARTLDSSGNYLAIVKDRLSRTATPTIPDEAFNTVRVALADELGRGSTISTISDRLGAELQWRGQDVGFWTDRRDQIDSQLDAILDAVGAPGDPAREAMRRSDPQVRELQQARSDAISRIDADRSQWEVRAERIARTETTGAFNAGAQQAYAEEGAGVKQWLATPDDRTREEHLEASGQCVPADQPFDVGGFSLQFPGDPSGPAELVVNCRCTTIAARTCEELGAISSDADRMTDRELDRRELEAEERDAERVERAFDL